MNRRTGLMIGWLAATVTSILIASAAVGSVRNNVSEQSTSVVVLTSQSTVVAGGATTLITEPTVPETFNSTTTSSVEDASTTSSTSDTTPASTSNTAAQSNGEIRTISGEGGTMTVEVHADRLVFLGAVPSSGFTLDEQHVGTTEIEVKFENEHHETVVEAKIEGGVFKPNVKEKDHEEDDD